MNLYNERIQLLRKEMKKQDIDCVLVLYTDAHLSEYIPNHWKSRTWLSGFKGSSGNMIITHDYAGLWTDGRYFLEAEKILQNTGIELQKISPTNTIISWLENNLNEHQTLCMDKRVVSISLFNDLRQKVCAKIAFVDIINHIWYDREALPKNKIYEHDIKYAIYSRKEKISQIRESLQKMKIKNHIISSLDDIAYITNLRGSDTRYNPVFIAFFLITPLDNILFVDIDKLDSKIVKDLNNDGIIVRDYNDIHFALKSLEGNILLDPNKTTLQVANNLQNIDIIESINPSTMIKAIKTNKEIAHIKEAMKADGVALCKFFHWLENALENEEINEVDIDKKLQYFRRQNDLYISDSFATIAGFKENGAIIHYRANATNCKTLKGNGFLLLDSGAQYLNGTTDITRVFALGEISNEQKRDYTLVLKAHIAISSAHFPNNTSMPMLDCIARTNLWNENIDYNHGTGHGVGYFLNVHEGPQVLSCHAVHNHIHATAGMIISIEPGIYRANKWGVRLENLVLCKKVENQKESEFGTFLCFEPLSLYAFESNCIDLTLLNEKEKIWLNNYHKMVFESLKDELDENLQIYLAKKCRAI